MIESIDYQPRKIIKTRGHLPDDDVLINLLYLGCKEMGRTSASTRGGHGGGRGSYSWKIALDQFDIMSPGRLDKA